MLDGSVPLSVADHPWALTRRGMSVLQTGVAIKTAVAPRILAGVGSPGVEHIIPATDQDSAGSHGTQQRGQTMNKAGSHGMQGGLQVAISGGGSKQSSLFRPQAMKSSANAVRERVP